MVLNLSWLIARINREKGSGHGIDDNDILNGQASAVVDSILEHGNEEPYLWQIAKTRKSKENGFKSDLKDVTRLASIFRKQLTENDAVSLPLIVYYPVNRAVVDIPLKIRTCHNFEQLDGYDNALQQGVDFRRFFEWFRDREDAENEQLNSQYPLVHLNPIHLVQDRPVVIQALCNQAFQAQLCFRWVVVRLIQVLRPQ